MSRLSCFFLLAVFLGWHVCITLAVWVQPEPESPIEIKTSTEALNILHELKDPAALKKAAIWLYKSDAPDALEQLSALLLDPKFLNRLDPYEEEYRNPNLRVNQVLEEIGKLSTPKAEEVLLKLTKDKKFTADIDQAYGLIRACGWLRNPSPKMLAFLDSRGETVVAEALARIGTAESCALLEKRIVSADGVVSDESSWGWFTEFIVPVRNKPSVAALYERVLSAKIPNARCRNGIVQSLFDYRPYEWYTPDGGPKPPLRQDASSEVLKQLLEIADMALKLDISPETREGVLKAQKEIQDILQKRATE